MVGRSATAIPMVTDDDRQLVATLAGSRQHGLQRHAQQRAGGYGHRQSECSGPTQADRGDGQKAAIDHELALSEIDDLAGVVDQGEPGGHEPIDSTDRQAAGQELGGRPAIPSVQARSLLIW